MINLFKNAIAVCARQLRADRAEVFEQALRFLASCGVVKYALAQAAVQKPKFLNSVISEMVCPPAGDYQAAQASPGAEFPPGFVVGGGGGSNELPRLAIVSPCYNEEEALPEAVRCLREKLRSLAAAGLAADNSKIVFVDDGSTDNTWAVIKAAHEAAPEIVCAVKLSRNRGHQNALLCGLLFAAGFADAAVSIDADLQDDVDAIDGMVAQYAAGCEVVYGVRSSRKTDTVFKRASAQGFYRLMQLLGADIVYNHADFRLLGKNALAALAEFGEVNLFLRGIVPMLGFKTGVVEYARKERLAGESKYPLGKMLRFALEGITSLSVKPIRMITLLGLTVFAASLVMIIYFFARHFSGHTVPGWSSMICSLWGIGGLILFAIGVVGEYIGKIYLETKHRPRFIVEQTLGEESCAPD